MAVVSTAAVRSVAAASGPWRRALGSPAPTRRSPATDPARASRLPSGAGPDSSTVRGSPSGRGARGRGRGRSAHESPRRSVRRPSRSSPAQAGHNLNRTARKIEYSGGGGVVFLGPEAGETGLGLPLRANGETLAQLGGGCSVNRCAPGYYGAVEPCRFDRFESVGSHSTVESHAIEFRMTDEHHPGQKPVQFLADLRQRRARPHRLRADPMKRNIQGIELHLGIDQGIRGSALSIVSSSSGPTPRCDRSR